MQYRQKTFAGSFVTALVATAFATAVHAAPNCGLVGNWHMNGDLDFSAGASVVDCSIKIKPTGAYTGTCGSWSTGIAFSSSPVSGTIKADIKCHLSGVLQAPSFADTTIGGGKVHGMTATLVGYRGDANSPTQVRFITLIRE